MGSSRSREPNLLTRRELVKRGAVLVGGTALAPAYASSAWARSLRTDANTIKIGFVSPLTGAASAYAYTQAPHTSFSVSSTMRS